MAAHRIERGLGYQLQQRRLELGLTQEEVAQSADVSRRHLAQIEAGNNFGVEILIRLARVLRMKEIKLVDLSLTFAEVDAGVAIEALVLIDRARETMHLAVGASSDLDALSERLRNVVLDRSVPEPTTPDDEDVETFINNARLIGTSGSADAIDETLGSLAMAGGAKLRKRPLDDVQRRAARAARRR